jgi:hypothetical protein
VAPPAVLVNSRLVLALLFLKRPMAAVHVPNPLKLVPVIVFLAQSPVRLDLGKFGALAINLVALQTSNEFVTFLLSLCTVVTVALFLCKHKLALSIQMGLSPLQILMVLSLKAMRISLAM